MIKIHALGDSIVNAYGDDENNFIGGWGDHLQSFFDDKNVDVQVYAQGGRSTRSYLNEGRFIDNGMFTEDMWPYGKGPAYNKIGKGDYVLMQFCHNDDSSKGVETILDRMTPLGMPDENGIYPTIVPVESMKVTTHQYPDFYPDILYANGMSPEAVDANIAKYQDMPERFGDLYYPYDCGATYKGYLAFYINKIREKGAIPVLVCAPARQYYENGKIASVPGHHGGSDKWGDFTYIRAAKQLGKEMDVPVLDLFSYTVDFLNQLGREHARYIQSLVGPDGLTMGEVRKGTAAKWPQEYDEAWDKMLFAKVDDTHQNRLGSYIYAGQLAKLIAEAFPEISDFLLTKSTKKMAYPEHIKDKIGWIAQQNHLLNL